jgi:hypothetical protein
MKVSPP